MVVVCALAALASTCAPHGDAGNASWTTVSSALTSGDAYANPGANACSWTMGTSGIEKVITFSGGNFTLTSFKNKLAGAPKELIQGGATSPEVRFSWNGTTLTGASGGWTCVSGAASAVTVGGAAALQVDVTLSRTNVQITKHYVIFPLASLIREWVDYKNVGTVAQTLATPSFLEQHILGTDAAAARVTLHYMTGGIHENGREWTIQTTPLNTSYVRNFDSYDDFGCVDIGSTPAACAFGGARESSLDYMPWFDLFESASASGVIAGFDYFGRWRAPIGASNGNVSLSFDMPNYSSPLAPGATVTSPVAFVMTYKTDLDDMSNRLLDWQYRYLWDFTRPGYFAGVAAAGNWCRGGQPFQTACGDVWDQQGIRQKIFNLSDRERTIGFDIDWRDWGWWDKAGDWNGPDFRMTNDFLARSGIKSIVYYPVYGANTDSTLYAEHKENTAQPWFTHASPCFGNPYVDWLGDLSQPSFEEYVRNLLVGNAQKWGDYEFRNDACFITNSTGATQLAQDQAFRRVLRDFLTQRPGSAFCSVNSGGRMLGFDYVRYSSQAGHYDGIDPMKLGTAAYLFPVDKLSGDPNPWSGPTDPFTGAPGYNYCSRSIWVLLGQNLAFYAAWRPRNEEQGDTVEPALIECARKLVDTYHYLKDRGVVGRWVKQYHPASSDPPPSPFASLWFQRVNQAGTMSTIHRFGPDTTGSVTVFPKGLLAGTTYDVRYQFRAGSTSRTGSDLMANGIVFPSVFQGEIVYLGLPQRPGAGTDTMPPSAPFEVTAVAETNVNYPGVGVRWTPGGDFNWVSFYNVYRQGVLIGKVSKGNYYFDHSPAASPNAQYGVQTVDGDGNVSAIVTSTPVHANDAIAVDDPAFTYTGGWEHFAANPGNYGNTLSRSNTTSATASYTFTGQSVTLYVKLGPGHGKAKLMLDGVLDATVDLRAPDNLDAMVPIYSKTWRTPGTHTITISPDGTGFIYLDGLQTTTSTQMVTENSATSLVFYSGSWTHQASSTASNGDISSASSSGAWAEFAFYGSRVRIIGKTCDACGMADVTVDGVYDGRVDFWGDRGATVNQTVIYDRSFSTPGQHRIRLRATGTRNLGSTGNTIYVDSFQFDVGAAYGLAVSADRPSAWFRLGETPGAPTVADATGNGGFGTVSGGVTFLTSGALNSEPDTKGASFDGSTGWINLNNPTALQVGTGSLEAWVKTTNADSGYHAIAMKWFAYSLFLRNGRLATFDWGSGATTDSGVSISDGNWHHVVLTFQSGVANGSVLYVDGVAAATTTISVADQAHAAMISNGASTAPQQFFPGAIDEVAFYPTALSAARVKAHYDAARYGGLIAGDAPAAWYRLQDAAGSSMVNDASGNGLTGTVHGGITFNQAGALAHEPAMKAAAFDGSTGWIGLGNPSVLRVNNGSLEAWVKTTNTDNNYHAIAMKWFAYGLFLRNGRLVTFDWGSGAPSDSGVNIADGNWHHVALTFQSGIANGSILYVDGVTRLLTKISVADQLHDALISNGASSAPQQFFPGTLDEVAYYPTVLSGLQVLRHHLAGIH
jgi:hypothetical protein